MPKIDINYLVCGTFDCCREVLPLSFTYFFIALFQDILCFCIRITRKVIISVVHRAQYNIIVANLCVSHFNYDIINLCALLACIKALIIDRAIAKLIDNAPHLVVIHLICKLHYQRFCCLSAAHAIDKRSG